VRKPSRPLEQIVRRLCEQKYVADRPDTGKTNNAHFSTTLAKEHHSNCIPSSFGVCQQYKKLTVNGVCVCVSVGAGNNCITMGSDIALVRNIVVIHGETIIMYNKFKKIQSFFTYPWDSSRFRIYQVSNLGSELVVGKLVDFRTKNVMLPYSDSYVVIPLLHV